MRASVIMPRSPTNVIRFSPKRFCTRSSADPTVWGSDVLPANTSTATGTPCGVASRPSSSWS